MSFKIMLSPRDKVLMVREKARERKGSEFSLLHGISLRQKNACYRK